MLGPLEPRARSVYEGAVQDPASPAHAIPNPLVVRELQIVKKTAKKTAEYSRYRTIDNACRSGNPGHAVLLLIDMYSVCWVKLPRACVLLLARYPSKVSHVSHSMLRCATQKGVFVR